MTFFVTDTASIKDLGLKTEAASETANEIKTFVIGIEPPGQEAAGTSAPLDRGYWSQVTD